MVQRDFRVGLVGFVDPPHPSPESAEAPFRSRRTPSNVHQFLSIGEFANPFVFPVSAQAQVTNQRRFTPEVVDSMGAVLNSEHFQKCLDGDNTILRTVFSGGRPASPIASRHRVNLVWA
jgi:hypothetical protein